MKKKLRTTLLLVAVLTVIISSSFPVSANTVKKRYPGGDSGTITVIDYGNCGMDADAVLVESNGKYILMDTGYTDCKSNIGNSSVIRFLKQNGVRRLDLYLSHWHNDHYYLMSTIMKDPYFTIGTVYLPNSDYLLKFSASKNKHCAWYKALTKNIKRSGKSWGPHSYTEVMDTIKKKGLRSVVLHKGSSFTVGNAKFEVIWQKANASKPSSSSSHTNQLFNNTSLVTRVTIGGVRYLTAGDIHKSVEREMMSAGVDVKADIFKTSHHSNKDTSNCPEFLKKIGASWAVGTSSASGSCRKATKKAGTNYINLKNNGQITIKINKGEISVYAKKNLRTVKKTYKDAKGAKHTKTFQFDKENDYFFTKKMLPDGCYY